MKKIYFAGAIAGGRDKQKEYLELIDYLANFGEVLTKDIWNEDLTNQENVEEYLYKRHKIWLDAADIIIAEISIPSLGVGYELGYFEAKTKPIICLYDENSKKGLSSMISGNEKNYLIKYKNLEEVKEKLKKML